MDERQVAQASEEDALAREVRGSKVRFAEETRPDRLCDVCGRPESHHTGNCPGIGLPDKRCERCKDKVQEWVDCGADGIDVETVNDFLQHGGHLVNCPDRVSAGVYLTLWNGPADGRTGRR